MSQRLQLGLLTDPLDPRLAELSALMDTVFADPNIVLGLERMQAFLRDSSGARRFCVLVAMAMLRGGAVVGGSVFSYVPTSNCGFSEYIVADASVRGVGLGRMLFDARKAELDAAARVHGYPACRGLFIEADDPDRTPAAFLEAERATALDAWERLRLFDHLGFKRVKVPYVQPPLGPDKEPIDYLDLLFAPWDVGATRGRLAASGHIEGGSWEESQTHEDVPTEVVGPETPDEIPPEVAGGQTRDEIPPEVAGGQTRDDTPVGAGGAQGVEEIPAEWVWNTLLPVWSAWAPDEASERLAALRARVKSQRVRLEKLT